ncbi:MAG: alpha-glucan family phosphorylase [Ignavibacteriales bacterium]|nr:alpha-glucan family phosphorylase [Ignavibacteriales bacterium]
MAKKTTPAPARIMLQELRALAHNIWWAWNLDAQAFFRELSPQLWEQRTHNPMAILSELSDQELIARLGNPALAAKAVDMLAHFKKAMGGEKTWASVNAKQLKNPVAYFSAEFGFHESLRTYSGGLGILAGDHTKSAAFLGIPFIGITLFYRQGYFEQFLAVDGWQQEQYVAVDPSKLPIALVRDKNGVPIRCAVEIGFSTVYFVAWKLAVGRSTIYLLDTNLPENEERFRDLTAHVYGGDTTTRISQEIILGIGGTRMLRALGVDPSVFHMNEGHSAFLTLELLREQLLKGKDLKKAAALVKGRCVFTTHTPVPAGHDRFTKDLMAYAFGALCRDLGISIDELMEYGRVTAKNVQEPFCMTVLALKMSRSANGVSALHGQVSREMWKDLYPGTPVSKVPIGHITNGIHIASWKNEITDQFWYSKLGSDWGGHFLSPGFWKEASSPSVVTDEELWALRYELRRSLIEFVRRRLRRQYMRHGNGVAAIENVLNPDVLTIGFSRRFATYKRAPLLFNNFDRAVSLFNSKDFPLQLVFAGKAHPRDDAGKQYIKRIVELTKHPMLFGKVVFVENYDINVARHLVSGADVWLNTPRRPLEASGTSGQKVTINGGLNCSIMDGWWREAYDGHNGFSIGTDESPESPEEQDAQDAEFLYDVIKNSILPEFYDRNKNGIPVRWLKRIRRAIATLVPQYNTHRMVAEYVKKYYIV